MSSPSRPSQPAPRPVPQFADEASLLACLEKLSVFTETLRHPPVFTVEESRAMRASVAGGLPGGHAKTLYLKSKRDERVLAVLDEDRRADIKALAEMAGAARLSFASAERLAAELGVKPGAVTPFALLNARAGRAPGPEPVVLLDAGLMAKAPLYFHPLHNAATTAISPTDLIRFMEFCGYRPRLMEFPA